MENGKKEELFQVTIKVLKEGQITFEVKADEDENLPDPIKMVGLLEMVKSDVINGNNHGNVSSQKEDMNDMFTEVTLEEEDFELPQSEELVKMGKKVGDIVLMPKPIAFAREAVINELKAKKNSGEIQEGAPVTPIIVKNGDKVTTGVVEGVPGQGMLSKDQEITEA